MIHFPHNQSHEVSFLLDAMHTQALRQAARYGSSFTSTRGAGKTPFAAIVTSNFIRYGFFSPDLPGIKAPVALDDIQSRFHDPSGEELLRILYNHLTGEVEYLLRTIREQGEAVYFYAIFIHNGIALLLPPHKQYTDWIVASLCMENASSIKEEEECEQVSRSSNAACAMLRELFPEEEDDDQPNDAGDGQAPETPEASQAIDARQSAADGSVRQAESDDPGEDDYGSAEATTDSANDGWNDDNFDF